MPSSFCCPNCQSYNDGSSSICDSCGWEIKAAEAKVLREKRRNISNKISKTFKWIGISLFAALIILKLIYNPSGLAVQVIASLALLIPFSIAAYFYNKRTQSTDLQKKHNSPSDDYVNKLNNKLDEAGVESERDLL